MDMEVTTIQDTSSQIISINGELDANSAVELDTILTASVNQLHKQILIDCTHLNYISSAGIGVFTSKIEDCKQKGIALVLFGVNETVKNVFSILGLDQILPIENTLEEAKKAADDIT